MEHLLRLIAARLERIETLEAILLRLEGNTMSAEQTQALIDAGNAAALAIGDLNTKVDTLISANQSVMAQLVAMTSATTDPAQTAALQSAIDTLNTATLSAKTEGAKVDAAIAADTPAAAPAPVDTPAAEAPAAAPAADPVADPAVDPAAPAAT